MAQGQAASHQREQQRPKCQPHGDGNAPADRRDAVSQMERRHGRCPVCEPVHATSRSLFAFVFDIHALYVGLVFHRWKSGGDRTDRIIGSRTVRFKSDSVCFASNSEGVFAFSAGWATRPVKDSSIGAAMRVGFLRKFGRYFLRSGAILTAFPDARLCRIPLLLVSGRPGGRLQWVSGGASPAVNRRAFLLHRFGPDML